MMVFLGGSGIKGIKAMSPESPASANRFFTTEQSGKAPSISTSLLKAPRPFRGGKGHSLPVHVGAAPARGKLGQETGTWWEMGRDPPSLKGRPPSTPDPRGRRQRA